MQVRFRDRRDWPSISIRFLEQIAATFPHSPSRDRLAPRRIPDHKLMLLRMIEPPRACLLLYIRTIGYGPGYMRRKPMYSRYIGERVALVPPLPCARALPKRPDPQWCPVH